MPTYVSVAVPNKLILGTIHKRRRQFFWIFDTPLPHVSSFLVLSVANFDQFLTPPIRRRRLWTALKYIPFFPIVLMQIFPVPFVPLLIPNHWQLSRNHKPGSGSHPYNKNKLSKMFYKNVVLPWMHKNYARISFQFATKISNWNFYR